MPLRGRPPHQPEAPRLRPNQHIHQPRRKTGIVAALTDGRSNGPGAGGPEGRPSGTGLRAGCAACPTQGKSCRGGRGARAPPGHGAGRLRGGRHRRARHHWGESSRTGVSPASAPADIASRTMALPWPLTWRQAGSLSCTTSGRIPGLRPRRRSRPTPGSPSAPSSSCRW
jgi:hypothetical protein